jgi:hypothetical protein
MMLASPAVGSSAEPDRQARFVGALTLNHGLNDDWLPICEMILGEASCLPVPSGVYSSACDDEGYGGLDDVQGIGAVRFCRIPLDSRVNIRLEDDHLDSISAGVWCRQPAGYRLLFEIEGAGVGEIPAHSCFNMTAGGTELLVTPYLPPSGSGASMGRVLLAFL